MKCAYCVIIASALGGALEAQSIPKVEIIGSENGLPSHSFGYIGGTAVGPDGSVFVLDRFANSVSWFSPSRQLHRTIARRGGGPGELKGAYRMALDSKQRLHIYDVSSRKLIVYDVSGDNAVHIADQRLAVFASDVCTIGSRRFLATPRESTSIAEIDSTGRVIRSFGQRELPPKDLVKRLPHANDQLEDYYNRSLLTCNEQTGLLVLLHENIPIIRAFHVTGRLVWRTKLTDFNERIISQPPKSKGHTSTGFSVKVNEELGSGHSGSAVGFASPGRILFTLWEGDARHMEGELEARVVDANSGKILGRFSPRGRFTHAANGNAYAYHQYPYPHVLIDPDLARWIRGVR